MVIVDIHARIATALVMYLAVLGVWGIALGIRGSGPSSSFRGAIVIVEVAIAAQGLLGLASWATARPPEWIHVLYGAALLLALPVVATIVREGSPRRTSLMLGLASFLAMGLALRGIMTAS